MLHECINQECVQFAIYWSALRAMERLPLRSTNINTGDSVGEGKGKGFKGSWRTARSSPEPVGDPPHQLNTAFAATFLLL